ncbi:hypothetical protein DSO57_1010425 [Entomophthora muscae]|uniref:Uncharacterized protein n=1 Tax=Entomophthora muscae TaxID=34485 RepID=A0ACC2S8M4_9FUNG|nr:hypothetical protein DSO57_1010425 [Entomophthora muscae]
MTPPLTPQPDCPLEPTAAAETTSTQLFGVLYITLTGLVDSVVPNSGPWSLLGRSVSYIINLAPILWWALSASSAAPHPKPPNASTYKWLPEKLAGLVLGWAQELTTSSTTGKISKLISPKTSASLNLFKTFPYNSVIFLKRPLSQCMPINSKKYTERSKTPYKLTTCTHGPPSSTK